MPKRLILGVALALGATPALAATFSGMDSNHDGQIKKEEFYGHLANYSKWDRNDDGMISPEEFNKAHFKGKFGDWNEEGGDYLDSKEFYDGIFGAYDGDKNGRWDEAEWEDAKKAGLFRKSPSK